MFAGPPGALRGPAHGERHVKGRDARLDPPLDPELERLPNGDRPRRPREGHRAILALPGSASAGVGCPLDALGGLADHSVNPLHHRDDLINDRAPRQSEWEQGEKNGDAGPLGAQGLSFMAILLAGSGEALAKQIDLPDEWELPRPRLEDVHETADGKGQEDEAGEAECHRHGHEPPRDGQERRALSLSKGRCWPSQASFGLA